MSSLEWKDPYVVQEEQYRNLELRLDTPSIIAVTSTGDEDWEEIVNIASSTSTRRPAGLWIQYGQSDGDWRAIPTGNGKLVVHPGLLAQ